MKFLTPNTRVQIGDRIFVSYGGASRLLYRVSERGSAAYPWYAAALVSISPRANLEGFTQKYPAEIVVRQEMLRPVSRGVWTSNADVIAGGAFAGTPESDAATAE